MATSPKQEPEIQELESEIRAKAHGCLAETILVDLEVPDPPSRVAAQIIEQNTEHPSGPA